MKRVFPFSHTWHFTWAQIYNIWRSSQYIWNACTLKFIILFPHTLFSVTRVSTKPFITLSHFNYVWLRQAMCKFSSLEVLVFKGQLYPYCLQRAHAKFPHHFLQRTCAAQSDTYRLATQTHPTDQAVRTKEVIDCAVATCTQKWRLRRH